MTIKTIKTHPSVANTRFAAIYRGFYVVTEKDSYEVNIGVKGVSAAIITFDSEGIGTVKTYKKD